MRNKYLLSIAVLFVLFISFLPGKTLATSWVYSFVGVMGTALLINVLPQKSDDVDFKQKTSIIKKEESSNKLANNIIYSKETDLPLVASDGLFKTLYSDLKQMYSVAYIVAEIKVSDQNVLQTGESHSDTISNVEVINMYKGDKNLTNLLIAESGGPVDMTGFYEKYKDKPGDNVKRENPPIVESTVEGVPVMKKGNSYIVFLNKVPQAEAVGAPETLKNGYYIVVGSIQGKIKLDKSINKAVATVIPEVINEEKHFFQKLFAGKDINTLKSEIEKLQ